jgi:lysine 2,3-aminomutase
MKNDWQQSLAQSITTVSHLADRFNIDSTSLQEVTDRYPLRITPHYASLIEAVGDPIWRQCVPDRCELSDLRQTPDPLNEENLSPVPGLIHRYPDRAVWLVSNVCAVYCRFCMRKRRVGCSGQTQPPAARQEVIRYLRETPQVRDLILSGGDPLLLADNELAEILTSLRAIPHLEIIRIGSRVPVTLPERITPQLCRLLSRYQPLYLNTHFNHPREISPASAAACNRLADAGIPLGNQTVLLRGVNDDPDTMKTLMQRLLTIRVRPYYIHQADLVQGTSHFRTSVQKGIAIMEGLRGHTSGMATPYYVIDLPGGKGKVPLLPECVERHGSLLRVRNYAGELIEYHDVS